MSQQSPESRPAPLLNTQSVPLVKPARNSRDVEIESIKRTLYNAINKLDQLQRQQPETLTTT